MGWFITEAFESFSTRKIEQEEMKYEDTWSENSGYGKLPPAPNQTVRETDFYDICVRNLWTTEIIIEDY